MHLHQLEPRDRAYRQGKILGVCERRDGCLRTEQIPNSTILDGIFEVGKCDASIKVPKDDNFAGMNTAGGKNKN